MIGTVGSSHFWYRRVVALSLLLAACGGDGATSPSGGLTGVWRGHTPLGSPLDSLLLILVDSTGGVSASALWTPLDGVARLELSGSGQRVGNQLTMTLNGPQVFLGLAFDLMLDGGTLTGAMTDSSLSRTGPITLRRTLPTSQALVGRWVLTTVRGRAVTPGPDYADTLTLASDGGPVRLSQPRLAGGTWRDTHALHTAARWRNARGGVRATLMTGARGSMSSRAAVLPFGPTLTS
jgi:hypothetical protein